MTFVPTRPPQPMLARVGKLADLDCAVERGYIIEPKLDGIRCMAVLDNDGIHLYNRQLRNITAAFPDVCQLLERHASANKVLGRLVLDGEIFVRGPDGQPDFQLVQHRANRLLNVDVAVAEYPAEFVAFDVLSSGRIDYTRWSLDKRRAILAEIAPALIVATYTQYEAGEVLAAQTGEGLMLKHSSSKYEPGARSIGWLKIKWLREVEAVVGGVTFGIGKREGYFGGLLVGVYKPGDKEGAAGLQYIGTVGTGYNDDSLESLTARLHGLKSAVNPFTQLGSDWDLASFVLPTIRVKVRFANYTSGGIMRHPRFVGVAE